MITTISTYPTTGKSLTAEDATWTTAEDESETGIFLRQGDVEIWLSDHELAVIADLAWHRRERGAHHSVSDLRTAQQAVTP